MKNQTRKRIQLISWVLFVLYILLLMDLLFLSEGFGHRMTRWGDYRYNLIPFQEIKRFWMYRGIVGYQAAFLNIGGNIIGFCPLGFMLPVLSHRFRKLGLVTWMGFCLSLFAETIQLIGRVGSFDVDDLMLNTLGTVIGYICFVLSNGIRRWIYEKKI